MELVQQLSSRHNGIKWREGGREEGGGKGDNFYHVFFTHNCMVGMRCGGGKDFYLIYFAHTFIMV